MKQKILKICITITLLLCNTLYAQENLYFNKGGTSQKKYFTSIPYKEVKSKVIIQCFINNKPYNFIVDTGAITTISPQLYKELNLKALSKINLSDQSGKLDSLPTVTLNNIKLGDITFNDIPTVVAKGMQIFDCFNVDGLIGSNMLRNSIVQFASQTKLLTITDNPRSLNLKGKYATRMRTDKVQSNPFIAIRVNNDELKLTDNLLFDSGMDGFYDLSYKAYKEQLADKNLLKVEAQAVGSYSFGLHGLSDQEESYRIFAPELVISGYTFKNVTTATTHGGSSRIGANLFKYGNVTLDYIHKKLYFEPFDKEPKDLAEKSWPFIPTAKDGKIVIGLIWDKAWEGKINQDDVIVSFDGKTYENMAVCDALIKDNTSNNNTATLVLKDAKTGAVKEYVITR